MESIGIQTEIKSATCALSVNGQAAQLRSAESLLAMLRTRLDGPVPPELRRQLIENLVKQDQANTVERWGINKARS